MVMDVQAKPSTNADVYRGGSVPGKVQQTPGGVARNICECLARLCNSDPLPASARARLKPLLVSVLGQDQAGDMLLSHLQSLGLPTHAIHRVPGATTPSVSIIFDRGGEVAASVADVGALEERLPAVLRQHTADIQSAPLVMLDGNLSPDALLDAAQLASEKVVPIWYEPVSAAKAVRATLALHMMDYISPNAKELTAMAEALISAPARQQRFQSGANDPRQNWPTLGASEAAGNAVELLSPQLCTVLHAGVGCVVLTLGHLGAALCTLSGDGRWLEIGFMAAPPARVVNTSGAGDCLVAGALFGLLRGCSPTEALAHGIVCCGASGSAEHWERAKAH
ncbi:Ribokinase-like protein [Coccomyxa subellipsoidea C-169]|uniref:Ribokinase-like protein n=1 Tax=Coccomyxa subellipsoidea (strain C-169) TaxID=574566 RepID=I0Z1G9_COCSC|nr:Ribokinase-like protein [Coccomyxa subellipsoidea C-169]EIE24488.1 Ribokinase-like protein [Coccomyxa subellipsoidea C-169]|eukprot:XP_005649032.1 Ribokinase-like protein [Coccomyxa subellipsoidea C-169]